MPTSSFARTVEIEFDPLVSNPAKIAYEAINTLMSTGNWEIHSIVLKYGDHNHLSVRLVIPKEH